jgi:MEMO1 family protein
MGAKAPHVDAPFLKALAMKKPLCGFVLAAALLAAAGCQAKAPQGAATRDVDKVREPAVAGLFYPKDEAALKREIGQFLAAAKPQPVKHLRALVCPHAGYEFSGPVAASSYKQLAGQNFPVVILLGPSHTALFRGAFVPTTDAYCTPLGVVPLSPLAAALAKVKPFSARPSCEVQRPSWVDRSPKQPPPVGRDMPDTWEHSLEVQLPFLQSTLHDFSIVPVVFGDVDPAAVAEKLVPLLDDDTLLVVSSDLSHYHPYDEAKTRDTRTVKAICDLRADLIDDEDACGHGPLAALINIARNEGWKAQLLDYRNSGDTSGHKDGVVGYAAIAFFDSKDREPPPKAGPSQYTPEHRQLLLKLARDSVVAAVSGRESPNDNEKAPAKLRERRACFVTLTKSGDLRGCIGSIYPQESLYQAVIRRAKSAATEDSRFLPVRPDELKQIDVEVSVLTIPKPLPFDSPDDLLQKLRPGVDGVVLRVEDHTATYLPQVWDQLPDKRTFLSELSQKAGLPPDGWKLPAAIVMTYQVEAFREERRRRSDH